MSHFIDTSSPSADVVRERLLGCNRNYKCLHLFSAGARNAFLIRCLFPLRFREDRDHITWKIISDVRKEYLEISRKRYNKALVIEELIILFQSLYTMPFWNRNLTICIDSILFNMRKYHTIFFNFSTEECESMLHTMLHSGQTRVISVESNSSTNSHSGNDITYLFNWQNNVTAGKFFTRVLA